MLGKHYEKHRTQKSNGTAKKSKSTQTVQRPKHQNASLQRGSRNTLVFCASLIALASLLLHGTGAAYATPPAPTSSLLRDLQRRQNLAQSAVPSLKLLPLHSLRILPPKNLQVQLMSQFLPSQ